MPYAVYLDLDAAGSREFDHITGRIDALDVEISTPARLGHGHHLTLAVYDDLDADRMERALKDLASDAAPTLIAFPGIGCFPGERSVVFAAPYPTKELIAFHDRYHQLTASHGHGLAHYRPGSWFPHVTLAVDVARCDLGNVVAGVASAWAPLECRLDAIRLVKFSPVETLWLGSLTQR